MSKQPHTPTLLVAIAERKRVIVLTPPRVMRYRGLLLIYLLGRLLVLSAYYWLRGELTETRKGQLLASILERMGFLWVKIGHMMAKRTDLYSDEFCRELGRVRYREQGFPFDLVQQTLEAELGRPLEQVFKEFDPAPFRAMSVFQTHRAVLPGSDTWLAVKVQMPGIERTFRHDMTLIRRMVAFFKWCGIEKQLRWDSILWELNQVMIAAIDYRYEAANTQRMRKILRRQKIDVPRVYEHVSTRRVLVTEFIRGALMSDVIQLTSTDPTRLQLWLEENQVDLRRVGRRLFVSFLRQLMEENMVHGDLQPENIILLRDSRIAFVELAVLTSIEAEFLKKYVQSMRALANAQYSKAAELMLLLCPDLPVCNIAEVKERMIQCYRAWSARAELRRMSYSEKSLASMYHELSRILFARNIVPSLTFMNISHAWSTLDDSLNYLIPGTNYHKLFQKYFYGASQRSFRSSLRGGSLVSGIAELRSAVTEYQQIFGTVLRRGALVFQGGSTKLADAMAIFFKFLRLGLLALMFLLAVKLLTIHVETALPVALHLRKFSDWLPMQDPDILVLVLLGATYCYWTLGKLRRRFKQSEVRLPGTPTVPQGNEI